MEVIFILSNFHLGLLPKLKFNIWVRSNQWSLRYSTFNILRSSSFQSFFILVWSPELKFKIWAKSNQWLLKYLTFTHKSKYPVGWVAGWLGGWLAGRVIIVPLRGPSCKLRLARFSVKLKFQDGPSVAICEYCNFELVLWYRFKQFIVYKIQNMVYSINMLRNKG